MSDLLACPHCHADVTVADEMRGVAVTCPNCRNPFTVPGAAPAPAGAGDTLDELETDRKQPRRSSYRRKDAGTGKRGLWAAASLGAILLVVGAVVFAVSGGSERGRDRDYVGVLDQSYEIDAVLKMQLFWLDDHPRAAWFDDQRAIFAARVVSEKCESVAQQLEDVQTQRRKAFAEKHGMDSGIWRPNFTKRYPERDVIFDEITGLVRKRCGAQLSDASAHFVAKYGTISKELFAAADNDPRLNAQVAANGPKMIEDRLHEYRMGYLRQRAPQMIRELQEDVRKLESIQKLRAKVGVKPPAR